MGPFEIEPNDTPGLADMTGQVLALSPGSALNADLGPSEADVFRINVPSAGALRLEATGFRCSDFASTRLSLLDASANVLSTEDLSSASACRLMVAQVQAGTYYVSLARTATASQTLPYWVTATLVTGRTNEIEPNDTTNQATSFSGQDVLVCGSLSSTSDLTDIFLFTLSQPARLHAEVIESAAGGMPGCESGQVRSRLDLLSGAGLTLLTNTTSGRGSCSRIDDSMVLAPGAYFIRVTEAALPRIGFPYCVAVRLR